MTQKTNMQSALHEESYVNK